MIRLEETLTAALPIEDVFKYASDFANIDEWDPGVADSEKISRGPVGIGSEFRVILTFAFRKVPMNYQIIEFSPPEKVVLKELLKIFKQRIRFDLKPFQAAPASIILQT
ncbi:MAG: SRPBCC family protein [Desulfobacterales bacterium]